MTTRKVAYAIVGLVSVFLVFKAISFGIETRNSLIAEMKSSGGSVGSINRAENIQLATLNSNK